MAEAYKSSRRTARGRPGVPGTPAQARELRAQGRKTMRRLLDAGLRVFGDRGYHAARVDDIVRTARTSHGTFYLYFANKEELLRALAIECAGELHDLSAELPAVTPDAAGEAALRRFLDGFFAIYGHYGPVIRAWMEGHVDDREANASGVAAFTDVATRLGGAMRTAGSAGDQASIAALMALLERFAYFHVSRRLDLDGEAMLDTVTRVVHRGFFGASVPAS